MQLGLDTIEHYYLPIEESICNWIFKDEHGKEPTEEHKDQIKALNREASLFLWNFESNSRIECSRQHFKSVSTFNQATAGKPAIKKYLYQLGIPFRQKVMIAFQPERGFVLTWKMVIKYAHRLFWAHDQTVWDKTMNWKLEYHHDGEFTFGKDLIYDGQQVMLDNRLMLEQALKEMEERKRNKDSY